MTTPGVGTGGTVGAAVFTAAADFLPLIAESRAAGESLTALRGGFRDTAVSMEQAEKGTVTFGRTLADIRGVTSEVAAGNSRLAKTNLDLAGSFDKVAVAAAKYGDEMVLLKRAQLEATAGMDRLAVQTAASEKSLGAVGKAGTAARNGLMQVEGSANSAREALTVVGTAAERTSVQLKAAGTAAAEEGRAMAGMGAENRVAQRELAGTGAASSTMGRDVAAGGAAAAAGMRGAGAEAAATGEKTATLGGRMQSTGAKASALGGTLISKVQNPLLIAGAAAIYSTKQFSDFEKQQTLLMTSAGLTRAEMEKSGPALLKMGSDAGFTGNEMSHSFHDVASAFDSVLPPATRLSTELDIQKAAAMGARVGNADLTSTTNGLIATVRSGIGGIHGFADGMNQIVTTVGQGKMRMEDFNSALKSGILSDAHAFGLQFKDIGAAIATFTDMGVPAEMAANRIKTAIGMMADPSPKAVSDLKSIGLAGGDLLAKMQGPGGLPSALALLNESLNKTFPPGQGHALSIQEQSKALAEFKKELADTGVTGKAFDKTSSDMQKKLANQGSNQYEQIKVLGSLFGRSRSLAAGVLLLQNQQNIDAKRTMIGDSDPNALANRYADASKTTAAHTAQMKASFHNLAISMGQELAPAMNHLMGIMKGVADFMMKHRTIAKALADVLGVVLVAAIVGGAVGAVLKLGGALLQVGGTMVSVGAKAASLIARMAGLSRISNAAGLMNDAKGAGKAESAGQKAFNDAMNATGGGTKEVKVVEKGAEEVEGKLTRLGKLVARPFQAVWNFVDKGAKAVEGGIGRIGSLAKRGGKYVLDMSVKGAQAVGSGLSKIGSAAADVGKKGAKAALDLAKMAGAGIVSGLSKLGGAFASMAKGAVGAIRSVTMAMLANPWTLVLLAVIAVIVLIATHWKQFKEIVVAVWHAIYDAAKAVWKWISDAVSSAVSFVVDFVKKHWDLLLGIITGPLGLILGFVIKHWDDIKRIVAEGIAWVATKLLEGWNGIKGAFDAAWNGIKAALSAVWSFITGLVGGAINNVRGIISGVLGGIAGVWNSVWGGIRDVIGSVWNTITSTVGGAVNMVMGFVNTIIGGVRTAIDTISNLASTIGNLPGKALSFIGLAAGGPVPGSGIGDSTPAMLTPGEHVLTTSDVHNLGGHAGVMALRTAVSGGGAAHGNSMGGFATGGSPTLGAVNSQIGAVLEQIKLAQIRGGQTAVLRGQLAELLKERASLPGGTGSGHRTGTHHAPRHPGTVAHHRSTAAHHARTAAHHKAVQAHLTRIRAHTKATAAHAATVAKRQAAKPPANPALLGYLEAMGQYYMRQLGYANYGDAQRGLGLKVTGTDNSATWQALKKASEAQAAAGGGASTSGLSAYEQDSLNYLQRIATYSQAIVQTLHPGGRAQALMAGITPMGNPTAGSGGGITSYGVNALGSSPWLGAGVGTAGLGAFAHSGTVITGPVHSEINVTTNITNPVPQTAAETNVQTMQRVAALGLIPGA